MTTHHSISRRSFIQKTAIGFAAATELVGSSASMQAAGSAAKWPVTCRDAHLKVTGKPDCWSAMKELGVAGVEADVTIDLECPGLYHQGGRHSIATPEKAEALRKDLEANGLAVSAFLMYNRLDERLDQEVAWAEKLVGVAERLGVRAIRIDVVPRKTPVDQFLPFAIKACKRLCDVAAGTHVKYGIENHGHVTNDPAFLAKLFDGVGSSQLGLTLDTGNFYWFGHPLDEVYRIFEQVAPRAVHTHCKSIRFPADKKNVRREAGWGYDQHCCPIYEGDIDYKRVVAILRKAGYQGDLCVEDESLGRFPEKERASILKKEVAMLKGLA